MHEFSIAELINNLIPAILAGLLGGLGAYVAVKVDIAVLLSNTSALIEQGKDVGKRVSSNESDIKLLQYKVEMLEKGTYKIVTD